jgi:hypothetical protein
VQRIYGQDFSLMTEVVNDNENRNLFPEMTTSITPNYNDSSSQLNTSSSNYRLEKLKPHKSVNEGTNDAKNALLNKSLTNT